MMNERRRQELAGKKDIVLFVDDELHILTAIRRAVMEEHFTSLFASSGSEALALFGKYEISVLVTDMRMPGMDGLALLKAVKAISPKTVRIVLSGYTQLSQVLVTVNQAEIFQFISKPWQMEEELLMGVRRAIERYRLETERDNLRDGLVQKNSAIVNILREMEQKLSNEKKDIASVKHVSHWLFAFWKRHFALNVGCTSENKGENIRDIELIEAIQLAYLTVLPTVLDGRLVSQVVAELESACSGRLKLSSANTADPIVWGYFVVLVVIMKSIVYLHEPDAKQQALVDMSLTRIGEESIMLTIESKASVAAKQDQSRLKIGYAMLNEIGRAYDIQLTPGRTGEEIDRVQIQWKTTVHGQISDENTEREPKE